MAAPPLGYFTDQEAKERRRQLAAEFENRIADVRNDIVWQARQMSANGDLCLHCESCFEKILYPVEEVLESERWIVELTGMTKIADVILGWVDNILATKDCSLCNFIAGSFHQLYRDNPMSEVALDQRFLAYIPCGYTTRRTTDGLRLDWDLRIRFSAYEVSGLIPQQEERWLTQKYCEPSLTLCVDSLADVAAMQPANTTDLQFRNLAQPVGHRWNSSFAYQSLKTCLRHHGQACEKAKGILTRTLTKSHADLHQAQEDCALSAKSSVNLRVVDAKNMCIVKLPSHARYVALSYCWSKRPYLCSRKENMDALQTHGGIDRNALAPTIADALDVVTALDEQYLWVDSLCIIQDSDEDKVNELSKMHIVYREACLTIVAAGTSDANDDPGIPGIRRESRNEEQRMVELRGLRFIDRASNSWQKLHYSRWITRTWTFQEYSMSKRLLIFTPDVVRFSCECDIFAEDYVPKLCLHRVQDAATTRTCCQYQTPEYVEGGDSGLRRASNWAGDYRFLVRELTARDLSFQADILNAVRGLITVLAEGTKEKFICGLPLVRLVDLQLLWIPIRPIERRTASVSGHLFPSWSWAGWVGRVDWKYGGDGRMIREHSDADFIYHDNGTLSEVPKEATCSVKNISLQTFVDGKLRYSEFANWSVHNLIQLETAFLCFEASTAEVELRTLTLFPETTYASYTRDESDPRISTTTNSFHPHALQVHINNIFSGIVYVNSTYHKQVSNGKSSHAFVIELSRTTLNRISYPSFRETIEFWKNLPKHERSGREQPWCCNVLLVEFIDGIAYRLGAGQIHSQSWDAISHRWERIVLGSSVLSPCFAYDFHGSFAYL